MANAQLLQANPKPQIDTKKKERRKKDGQRRGGDRLEF